MSKNQKQLIYTIVYCILIPQEWSKAVFHIPSLIKLQNVDCRPKINSTFSCHF